ncbi:MAG: alpha-mannosidase, partial [Alphaproteobacteria bacterium]|nr:alpha-mannosidase [Alphaproteobacteria bacterium]
MTRYNTEKQQQKLSRLLQELEANIARPLEIKPELRISNRHGDDDAAALADDWGAWDKMSGQTVWGAPGSNTWFACHISSIAHASRERIIARVATEYTQICGRRDPQIQVWLNGAHYQAVNGYHREIDIPGGSCGADGCVIHMKAYKSEAPAHAGIHLDLLMIDEAVEKLFFDLQVPFEVACRLGDNDARKYAILELVDQALRVLDFRVRHSEALCASIPAAAEIAARIYALEDTVEKPTVVCTGHTHIDVAWLWTLDQTRQKMVRSFSTALDLMERFPDLVFMYNQCVLFDYLKQDAPDLFARVLGKVKTGQLEIEGAMWLEPDMNIINGESMVRHLLYGAAFHREQFGVRPKVVWLPDTFGYSAAMPQVLAKAGIEFFVTSKVSWNDTNRMPYDTFFWSGIDGTPIKSYLITTQPEEDSGIGTVYQLDLDVSHVMGAWKRYEPKAVNREIMLCYGHGDGGGGVTREMIERARRMEKGIPGCPNVRMEGIGPFFERLGAR